MKKRLTIKKEIGYHSAFLKEDFNILKKDLRDPK